MLYFQTAVFLWMLAVSALDVESSVAIQGIPGVVESNPIVVAAFGRKPTKAQFWLFKFLAASVLTAVNVGLVYCTAWQAGLAIPAAWTGMTLFWTRSNIRFLVSGNRTWWMKILS